MTRTVQICWSRAPEKGEELKRGATWVSPQRGRHCGRREPPLLGGGTNTETSQDTMQQTRRDRGNGGGWEGRQRDSARGRGGPLTRRAEDREQGVGRGGPARRACRGQEQTAVGGRDKARRAERAPWDTLGQPRWTAVGRGFQRQWKRGSGAQREVLAGDADGRRPHGAALPGRGAERIFGIFASRASAH